MAIGKEQVRHVALLARLRLTDEEQEFFGGQLSQILEHIDRISALDTSQVEPTAHALEVTNVFREDESGPCLSQEEALANAPKAEDGGFVVPRIVPTDIDV
ncbi:MAG: Asp-tRNA(Asn)/Glu-tRNA(Gln) amidotransferase subunit GatC [Actinobacteria bacterium]|nr:MAG: Asp-tRNA(Asn)/Glu-tRNA(Gln) amidotransferase subunit GatC [Actinomycetota bacterium]